MKRIMPFLVFSFLVVSTKLLAADRFSYISDWNIDGEAKTEYIVTETKERGRYRIYISNDTNGIPRVYIEFHRDDPVSACTDTNPLPTMIKVQEQNISVDSWCPKYSDTDRNFLRVTAKNSSGVEFILNKFKKEKQVKVDLGSLGWANISAKGFSREWIAHAKVL